MRKFKFLKAFGHNNPVSFTGGLSAGLMVFTLSLPLAIVFAIAGGVSPDRGMWTAVIGGFIISVMGGSRGHIGGPSGILTVVVYALVSRYHYSGLAQITIIAGFFLLLIGFFKLGGLIRCMPYSILAGFTAGSALLLCASQLGPLSGFAITGMPPDLIGKISAYCTGFAAFQPTSFLVALGSFVLILISAKVKIPSALVTIVAVTVVVAIFKIPVATIGSHFGPAGVLLPGWLPLSPASVAELLLPAAALAILIANESLLTGVVADGLAGHPRSANRPLVVLGIANVLCALLGGIPASATVEPTVAAIRNGGNNVLAGCVNSVLLLAAVVFFGRFVGYVPMPTIAAIVVFIALRMIGLRAIVFILKAQWRDGVILIGTCLITVSGSVIFAMAAGLLLAALCYLKKIISVPALRLLKNELNAADCAGSGPEGKGFNRRRPDIQESTLVFDVVGPLFFGGIQKFAQVMAMTGNGWRVLILRMRNTLSVSDGDLNAIALLNDECRLHKRILLLSNIHTQPFMMMVKNGLDEKIGENAFFGNLDEALAAAVPLASGEDAVALAPRE